MKDSVLLEGKIYISSRRAAEISHYTTDYVGQLCRSGKVDCRVVGRAWFVTEESLMKHQRMMAESLTNGWGGSNSGSKNSFDKSPVPVVPPVSTPSIFSLKTQEPTAQSTSRNATSSVTAKPSQYHSAKPSEKKHKVHFIKIVTASAFAVFSLVLLGSIVAEQYPIVSVDHIFGKTSFGKNTASVTDALTYGWNGLVGGVSSGMLAILHFGTVTGGEMFPLQSSPSNSPSNTSALALSNLPSSTVVYERATAGSSTVVNHVTNNTVDRTFYVTDPSVSITLSSLQNQIDAEKKFISAQVDSLAQNFGQSFVSISSGSSGSGSGSTVTITDTNASDISSGVLVVAHGGTGLTSASSSAFYLTDGSGNPYTGTTVPSFTLGGDVVGNNKSLTGLNQLSVVAVAATNVAASTVTASTSLTLPYLAGFGSTQCLEVGTDGVVSATGSLCGSGSGSVSTVTNSDGTLTISPTSGAVVASLNLAHANTWTGAQTFNATTTLASSLNGILYGTNGLVSAISTSSLGIPSLASTTQWASAYASTSVLNGFGVVSYNGSTGTISCPTCLVNNQLITLSGDVSGSGTTSIPVTLASVNSSVGSFGSSTAIPNFTVNGKGLITAIGTSSVVAPAGTLTGTTLASNVVTSSLTSLGTVTNLSFTNASGTNATTSNAVITNATTTNATTTNLAVTGTPNALLSTNSAGSVVATTSINTSLLSTSTIYINNGTGISGGGAVSLGSSLTFSNGGVISVSCTTITCSGTNPATFSIGSNVITNSMLANSTISGIALGGNLASLTANVNNTLTFSGAYNGSTTQTIGLNLGNTNTWTALQTFANNISFGGATLNVSALTSGQFLKYNGSNWINTAIATSDVNGVFALGNGGTGTSTAIANDLLIGNSSGTGWTEIGTSSLGITSSQWTTSGSNIYYNVAGGNVGIGKSNPLYALDINGSINIAANQAYNYNGAPVITGSTTLDNFFFAKSGNLTATGNENVGIGSSSLMDLTSGQANTTLGSYSGQYLTSGTGNVLLGQLTGIFLTTGSYNTMVGNDAGEGNPGGWTGGSNVFVGASVANAINNGFGNTDANTIVGTAAAYYPTAIGSSTIMGYFAGFGSGSNFGTLGDTLYGYKSGYSFGTGASYNTLLGYQSGYDISSGAYNIAIGQNVDLPSNSSSQQLNIGNLIYGTGLYNGSTMSSTPVAGSVGIGSSTPAATLGVNGSAYIAGNVTATGTLAVTGTATSTFAGNLAISSTATSTFAGGIVATCFATTTNGPCISGGSSGGVSLGGTNTWTGQQTFSTLSPIFSTMTQGSIFFAGSGGLLSQNNSDFFWDNTNNALDIGTTSTITSNVNAGVLNVLGTTTNTTNLALFMSNVNNPARLALVNGSAGTMASADFVIGNNYNNSSSTSYYGDLGINSSGNTNASRTGFLANDTYLFSSDGGLDFGTATTSTTGSINFFTGGLLTANNRMTITSTGLVGIATSTPSSALTVAGSGYFTDNLTVATSTGTTTIAGNVQVNNGSLAYDVASGVTNIDSLQTGALNFDTDAGVLSWADLPIDSTPSQGTVESYSAQIGSTPILTIYGEANGSATVPGVQNTRVGIGTTTPLATLDVVGMVGTDNPFIVASSSGTQYFGISSTGTSTFGGFVGIGTSTPSSALTVVGNGYFTGNITVSASTTLASSLNGVLFGTNGLVSSISTSSLGILTGGVTNALTYWTSATTLGATTSPVADSFYAASSTATSTFLGNLSIGSGTGDAAMQYGNDSSAWTIGYKSSDSSFRISSSTTLGTNDALTILKGGNVGIGTSSPTKALSVSGNVLLYGLTTSTANQTYGLCLDSSGNVIADTVAAGCVSSSERFKNDIQDLNISGLSEVMALRPVSFVYNTDGTSTGASSTQQVGFIAEEAQQVDPRLIGFGSDGLARTFKYENYTAILTKAIQEQQGQIGTLASTTGALTVGIATMGTSTASIINQLNANFQYLTSNLSSSSQTVSSLASAIDMTNKEVNDTTSANSLAIAALQTQISSLSASTTFIDSLASSIASSTGSFTATTLASSTPFIQTIANAVIDILESSGQVIQSTGNWAVGQITATVGIFTEKVQSPLVQAPLVQSSLVQSSRLETQTAAVSNGIEMTDSATGSIYCVQVVNGQLHQTLGACPEVATSTLQVASSTVTTPPATSTTTAPTPTIPTPIVSTPALTTPVTTSTSSANASASASTSMITGATMSATSSTSALVSASTSVPANPSATAPTTTITSTTTLEFSDNSSDSGVSSDVSASNSSCADASDGSCPNNPSASTNGTVTPSVPVTPATSDGSAADTTRN